jgi:hypothetical protein
MVKGSKINYNWIFFYVCFTTRKNKFTPPPHDQKHGQSLALLRGSFQALTPNNVKELLNQQMDMVELTKGGQTPTPFLGRIIKSAIYSCTIGFINTTIDNSATN